MADNSSYLWLLKPTFLNRGRGIEIFNDLGQLEKFITDFYEGLEEKPLQQKKKRDSEEEDNGTQA